MEIPNEFNTNFSSIASALRLKTNPWVVANDGEPVFSMALAPEEVRRVIQKFNSKKMGGTNWCGCLSNVSKIYLHHYQNN